MRGAATLPADERGPSGGRLSRDKAAAAKINGREPITGAQKGAFGWRTSAARLARATEAAAAVAAQAEAEAGRN